MQPQQQRLHSKRKAPDDLPTHLSEKEKALFNELRQLRK